MENKGKQFKGNGIKKYIKEDWEDDLGEEREDVVEYIISFEPGELYDEYGGEFITDDKGEADDLFDDLKEEHKLDQVSQYIEKTWEWDKVNEEYYEGDVDVYFYAGDELEVYGENKEVESVEEDYKDLPKLPNDLYKRVQQIKINYDENKDNEEDDVFAGTEDSYANENLDDELGQLIFTNKPDYLKIYIWDNFDTTTRDLQDEVEEFIFKKLKEAIVNNTLSKYKKAGKKTEDLSVEEENKLAGEIEKYLTDNQLYPTDVFAADTRVMVEIKWGDWKHEHLRCDDLMKAKGYSLVEEEVTEEDGSDCYSAIRHYEPEGKFDNVDIQESKKIEGYSLGDDKESFDIYKHTADFLNKVGKALEDLGWKFNKEKSKFEKEDITIDMEALQDNVDELYIGSNKLKLSKFADDFSGYEDIGEDTDIIYYVSAKAGDYEARQLASKINSCEKLEENKEVKTESLGDRYEVWQSYYEDGRTTTEYVMSFDNYAEAQRFASGLMQDPDCDAWVEDTEEESNIDESKEAGFEDGVLTENENKMKVKYLPIDEKQYARNDIQDYIDKNNLRVKKEYDNDRKTNSSIATGYIKVYCTPEQREELLKLINNGNKIIESKLIVTNIKWDTDGEDIDLPKEMEVELPEYIDETDEDEVDEYVSDYISDETGFCHYGFDIKEVKTEAVMTSNKVSVYQIQETANCSYLFMGYDFAVENGGPDMNDYEKVAEVEIDTRDTDVTYVLDEVFTYGNTNIEYYDNNPKARSISVSDILEYNGNKYYVDSFGFKKLEDTENKQVKTEDKQDNGISLSEAENKCKEVEKLLAEKLPDYNWLVNISAGQIIISDLNSKSDFRYTKKNGWGKSQKQVEDIVSQVFGTTATLDFYDSDVWAKHKAIVKGINILLPTNESEEKVDYSKFTPTNKVLSGNKGLSEDKIDEMRWALPDLFKNMTDEQKQIFEELSLREMVMSCLVYGDDIHTAENNVSLGKYRGKPYVAEYYDTLGKDVTEEIIKQQTDYFNRGKVIKDVGTDSEGVTYNSFEEPEEESKKVTEAKYGDSNPDKIVPDAYCEIEKTDKGYYINCGIGDHTNLGSGNFTIYPEDYLSNLHKEVKKLAKERGIKRVYDKVKTIIPEYNAMIPEYNDNIENMIKDLTPFAEKSKQGQLTRADLDSIEEITGKITPNRMSTLPEFEWSGKFGKLRSLLGNLKRYETDLSNPLASADTITITESKEVKTEAVNKFQTMTTDKDGNEMLLKDVSYNNACYWLEKELAKAGSKVVDTEIKGNKTIIKADNKTKFEYDEEKGTLKRLEEAEDMTQVKDAIETAVEKSDSTDLEKEQVKGSLDVLKTDEESAIEGYEDFKSETEKVADEELADVVNNQMEEIIDDEKEHIEKLDTIKSALGENKKTEAEVKRNNSKKRLDYKLDGFKGVNIIVVDKKNNIDTEDYMKFDSMEFGIDEYEFEDSMIDGIKNILTDIYEYTDDYYDDRFTTDEITEMAEDITQDVLQLYDDLPDELIDFENGIANLDESKSITEAIDPEAVKEKVEKAKADIGLKKAEEMIDTEKELTEGIKKEIIQYAKQQGLDVEKLQKQGQLDSVAEALDNIIGEMVSKTAVEYMDTTGKDIEWDFDISNNDIQVIIQ